MNKPDSPFLRRPSGLTATLLALPFLLTLGACASLPSSIGVQTPVLSEPDPGPDDPEEERNLAANSPDATKTVAEKTPPPVLYEWNGEGRAITRIVVDTNEQKARFYSGGEEVGWSFVATGISNYPTPVGRFAVMEKTEVKRSNLYGKVVGQGGRVLKSNAKAGRDPVPAGARFEGASMPYFMRLTYDGIGLHAGPIPRPGRPASHGCIRMPAKLAPVLFRHVSHGTEVAIVGKGPDYGNYVEKQRAIAAAEQRRREEQRAAAEAAAQQSAVMTDAERVVFGETGGTVTPVILPAASGNESAHAAATNGSPARTATDGTSSAAPASVQTPDEARIAPPRTLHHTQPRPQAAHPAPTPIQNPPTPAEVAAPVSPEAEQPRDSSPASAPRAGSEASPLPAPAPPAPQVRTQGTTTPSPPPPPAPLANAVPVASAPASAPTVPVAAEPAPAPLSSPPAPLANPVPAASAHSSIPTATPASPPGTESRDGGAAPASQ